MLCDRLGLKPAAHGLRILGKALQGLGRPQMASSYRTQKEKQYPPGDFMMGQAAKLKRLYSIQRWTELDLPKLNTTWQQILKQLISYFKKPKKTVVSKSAPK